MNYFAVIDTETNWAGDVMSIGCCIAEAESFRPVKSKYYILSIYSSVGGRYFDALRIKTPVRPMAGTRWEAIDDLTKWLRKYHVSAIFAYNASSDRDNLPELDQYCWYDITRLAAYRHYNPKIPETAELYASGRLKCNSGAEPMLQLLSGDSSYRETHNALLDALDALEIMRLLGHPLEDYIPL